MYRTYSCRRCGLTFDTHWTAEQAHEEFCREFSEEERKYGVPAVVCDGCYGRIVACRQKHHLVAEDCLKI